MNKIFQNYSMLDRSDLMTDAGFAIVSAYIVKPTGKEAGSPRFGVEAGLTESIFWNNLSARESQSSESGRKW